MLVRTRNENADIANNYSALPLNGSSNASLSEFRGTARNSESHCWSRGQQGHKPEGICRNRFSRCSTDGQVRRIQFLDAAPQTTVGSARSAFRMDHHRRPDMVASYDKRAWHCNPSGTKTSYRRWPVRCLHVDTAESISDNEEFQQQDLGSFCS